MRRMAWTFVVALGVSAGAAVFMRVAADPPTLTEFAATPQVAARDTDESSTDQSSPGTYEESAHAPAVTSPAGVRGRASASGRNFGTESEGAAGIEEEILWTERALAASRRFSESAGVGRQSLASSASREALAAAASGSSARALGCAGAGLACLSSAECCPGLACSGGVAGYGTAGRCAGPR